MAMPYRMRQTDTTLGSPTAPTAPSSPTRDPTVMPVYDPRLPPTADAPPPDPPPPPPPATVGVSKYGAAPITEPPPPLGTGSSEVGGTSWFDDTAGGADKRAVATTAHVFQQQPSKPAAELTFLGALVLALLF